jgi:outer membrane protein insertion porin family
MAGVRHQRSPFTRNTGRLGIVSALPVLGLSCLLPEPAVATVLTPPPPPPLEVGKAPPPPPGLTPPAPPRTMAWISTPATAAPQAAESVSQLPSAPEGPAVDPMPRQPTDQPATEEPLDPTAPTPAEIIPTPTDQAPSPTEASPVPPDTETPGGPAPDPFSLPEPAEPGAAPGPLQPGDELILPEPQAAEPRVLITEVVIEGLEGHPEREQLELAAYGALRVTPGTEVTRSQLREDLAAVYDTGWFSDARIEPVDTPLGVRLVVLVTPNPVLTRVTLDPPEAKLPESVVEDTFAADLGRTLNLKNLQTRMKDLQQWYADQGYSLARVSGPERVTPEGEVQLLVREGTVEGVEVQFLTREGEATDDNGRPIRGKTKEWVITREISLKPGQVFNRRELEEDLKRLYGTGLFSDVKVTLKPVPANPGQVVIVLGIAEQSTGSLSGGLGYSQSQGVFGQIQLQDNNLLGRAWDISTSFTYGQFGGLADISFADPWIKGDPFRTAFRMRAFISREVPQIFQSQDEGNIYTVNDFYEAPGTSLAYNVDSFFNPLFTPFRSVDTASFVAPNLSWFDYDGNSVVIQRVGGNLQFIRPLNGGNPYKRAPWSVLVGLNIQNVTPMDFSGDTKRFAAANNRFDFDGNLPTDAIICIAYNCATSNQLFGIRLAATLNTLDDPRNPTSGNFFTFGTEQFISVGPDSPTFNRVRGSFSHFIPVNWIRFYRGCRVRPGETAEDCKQALAFQLTAGANIGNLPPYEAFCVGGGNSVRGYYDCDLGVGRSYGEATIEYRFPLFKIISGSLFVDGGTTFGTQDNVPGNPGELLNKPGSGFSVGTGVIVTTPVGPLRLEVASQDFSGDWRFNLGVGWKF